MDILGEIDDNKHRHTISSGKHCARKQKKSMSLYTTNTHWDMNHPVPVLHITVTGALTPQGIPTLIHQAHTIVDQNEAYNTVYLAYDITGTSGKLPLKALMQVRRLSSKVKRVAIIGASSRSDEMAVLIMASARSIPYEFGFFHTPAEAAAFLAAPARAHV